MKKIKNLAAAALLILFWATIPLPVLSQDSTENETVPAVEPISLAQGQVEAIDAFVQQQMARGKIPGMSVVIVMGDQTVYEKGFGFANLEKKEPVTTATMFELGSCSKAFTGLGILLMEKEGLLNLSDPVSKYLPWLQLKFKGKEVHVTVEQFLHQTSGVPFESIAAIPVSGSDDALEMTVRTLVGKELVHEPGKAFLYATINYDVLGLILQQVSGKSFEEYMRENVLIPLGLTQTVLPGYEGKRQDWATGYKLCFGKPSAYDAPVYRGNSPAGYIIMNAGELAGWLKIQLGTVELPGFDKELITKSHVSDPNLTSSNYAAGWFVFNNSGQVIHGGNNPNFSSMMVFSPGEKIGIGVLANRNSNFTTGTAQGIGAILKGEEPKPSFAGYDMNMRIDGITTKVVLILLPFIFLAVLLLIRSIFRIINKKKQFSARGMKGVIGFIISSVLMIAWVVVIIKIPSFLGFDLPLGFGFVWMPKTFTYAILALFLLGAFYYLFFLSAFFFRKKVN